LGRPTANASSLGEVAQRRAGIALLALAVPALFLHLEYQASADVTLGGLSLTIALADVAVAAIVAAAVAGGFANGFDRLRPGLPLWLAAAAFLALIVASVLLAAVRFAGYEAGASLVSAAKFVEYALLAPAVVLLVRTRLDLLVLLAAVAAWSAVASAVGVLQFLGLADEFEGRRPGQREPSWLGVHDFAAFSGAALALALVAIALGTAAGRERAVAAVAGASGALGLVLAAALDAIGAMLLSAAMLAGLAAVLGVLTVRRAALLTAVVAVVTAGALALRGNDLDQFLRFLGVRPASEEPATEVQTHAHRFVLLYIGGRIFLDQPLLGVGWQGSAQEFAFGPYVADARARFPDQPERAFPAAERRWGVQNAYVQALAELGVLGLLSLLALFAAGLWLAGATALRGPPREAGAIALSWILFAFAGLAALGLYAGVPLDALLWLALGLAAAARAGLEAE
jgi:O-antigen ligase